MSTTTATATAATVAVQHRRRIRWQRVLLHVVLISLALVWLFPILWTLYTALRPYADTSHDGYVSIARTLNFDNFVTAWNRSQMPKFFLNTLIIAIPAVTITLFVSSMLGFVFSRFSFRFNLFLLMMFTAGNLLPPQVIIVPLYRIYLLLPLPKPLSDFGVMYDSYFGVILIHIVFQTGFCTFVMSNYMKTISRELTEAALVDGASLWTIYRKVILPLCRPGARGPGRARVHVHLQRLLLGAHADEDRATSGRSPRPSTTSRAPSSRIRTCSRLRRSWSPCPRSPCISCSRPSSCAA